MKTIALLGLVAASALADEYKQACLPYPLQQGYSTYVQNTMTLEMTSDIKGSFTQVIKVYTNDKCESGLLSTITAKGEASFVGPSTETVKIEGAEDPIAVNIEWASKTLIPADDTAVGLIGGLCPAFELEVGKEANIDAGCDALKVPNADECPIFYHVIQMTADKEKIYVGVTDGFLSCEAADRPKAMIASPYEHVHDEDDSASALYGSVLAVASGLVASFFALH